MELQEMKALWQISAATPLSDKEIQQIVRQKSSPLYRAITRQLLWEIGIWMAVLFLYSSAFDGANRSLGANLVLIVGLLQAIVYNLTGYFAARDLIHGSNIFDSIQTYIRKLHQFRWIALASRLALMISILVFFGYPMKLNPQRMISTGAILGIFSFQLWLIYRSWTERIVKLHSLIQPFDHFV